MEYEGQQKEGIQSHPESYLPKPGPLEVKRRDPYRRLKGVKKGTPGSVVVAAPHGLRLRQGPGVKYPVLGILPYLVRVEVVFWKANDGWVQVRTGDGTTGYAAKAFLSFEGLAKSMPITLGPKKIKEAVNYHERYLGGAPAFYVVQLKEYLARGVAGRWHFSGVSDEELVYLLVHWQSRHNLDVTGKLDQPTVRRIELGKDKKDGFVMLPKLSDDAYTAQASYRKEGGWLWIWNSKDRRPDSYNDVNQLYLGDCWVEAAISAVAHVYPERLKKQIIRYLGKGIYEVTLYAPGPKNKGKRRPVKIKVRGMVVKEERQWEYQDVEQVDKASYRDSKGRKHKVKELWVVLLQQAVAKYFDLYEPYYNAGKMGYERLDAGGLGQDILPILLGRDPKVSYIHSPSSNQPNQIIEKVMDPQKNPVTIGSKASWNLLKHGFQKRFVNYLTSLYGNLQGFLSSNEIKQKDWSKVKNPPTSIGALVNLYVNNQGSIPGFPKELNEKIKRAIGEEIMYWVGILPGHEHTLLERKQVKKEVWWKVRNPWGWNAFPPPPDGVVVEPGKQGMPKAKEDDDGVFWIREKDVPVFFDELTVG